MRLMFKCWPALLVRDASKGHCLPCFSFYMKLSRLEEVLSPWPDVLPSFCYQLLLILIGWDLIVAPVTRVI